jgi:hypothetical protein
MTRISDQWAPSGSIRTDTRTYMAKLIVAFRNFEKAPTNVTIWMQSQSQFSHVGTLDMTHHKAYFLYFIFFLFDMAHALA